MKKLYPTMLAAFSHLTHLSPVKRWTVALAIFSAALLVWHQLSPASFGNAWLSKDQQAAIYFRQGQYQQANAVFESPAWKAYSSYFSGDFSSAVKQLESIDHPDKYLAIANAYAHSGQFEKAQALYRALFHDEALSEAAKKNHDLVAVAMEKLKDATPEKSTNKTIDDREIASEESDKKSDKPVLMSDQIWLNQVRQDPSSFLRQKFQSEYANEQN
ncbi:hypothetical protein [Agarivorans aestuarii]|uniref:hypothetical protein n=1 Tax=Agarivorans aestuarii TaxID=1563703 RepID=UPI001C816052|nr:hypothetical protein [Agarivorans aestuarii]